MTDSDKTVEACICELQEPLYRMALGYGPPVVMEALSVIVGASLRALILHASMTRLGACRLVDRIEKLALGPDEPPPGSAITEMQRAA